MKKDHVVEQRCYKMGGIDEGLFKGMQEDAPNDNGKRYRRNKMACERVSIIIPAYNAETFIERSVMSAVNQTYPNVEVIVVNDGSMDLTANILEQLQQDLGSTAHSKILKCYTQPNGGVSVARNKGLSHASGDFYMFLDADDELEENAVELMHRRITETNADIVIGDRFVVQEDGTKTRSKRIRDDNEMYSSEEAIKLVIKDDPYTYSCYDKLYRTSKLQSLQFPVGMRSHEDSYYVFLCLLNNAVLVTLSEPVYCYHDMQGSTSKSEFSDKYKDMLYLANEKKRLIDEKYPDLIKKSPNIIVKANMSALINICTNSRKMNAGIARQCIKVVKDNKEAFVPSSEFDKKFFKIIIHNQVYLFRQYIKVRKFVRHLREIPR